MAHRGVGDFVWTIPSIILPSSAERFYGTAARSIGDTRTVKTRSPLSTDIRPVAACAWFLPVKCRMPLKFGHETLIKVDCVRIRLTVVDRKGQHAEGWGETPLSVPWAWTSVLPYDIRDQGMKAFCRQLAKTYCEIDDYGHPLEVGHDFLEHQLPQLLKDFNAQRPEAPLPYLAALVCASAFDLALHDAFGMLHKLDIYDTYHSAYMSRDLSTYLQPAADLANPFSGKYPADYFAPLPPKRLKAWHLVGGLDPLEAGEAPADPPQDGLPVVLTDWIKTDGLTCLKVKLRGNDTAWDFERLVRVGQIAEAYAVDWLSADFNCTVHDPEYVNQILDQLRDAHPRIYGMILYVEQPFPYDLETHRIPAHSVAARKPLFLDESAHDWKYVRLGRSLGWSGVALKTCKTQTGALLSLCWAKAHGMPVMVQDLSNPMLAQIPHVRLASYAGTIMGVETNGMQFYPSASAAEAAIHPDLYQRRGGMVDWHTVSGPGFGYRIQEIPRVLPEPAVCHEI